VLLLLPVPDELLTKASSDSKHTGTARSETTHANMHRRRTQGDTDLQFGKHKDEANIYISAGL
jgi:hypothetical protein